MVIIQKKRVNRRCREREREREVLLIIIAPQARGCSAIHTACIVVVGHLPACLPVAHPFYYIIYGKNAYLFTCCVIAC